MDIRQTALDMVVICDRDYKAYLAIEENTSNTIEALRSARDVAFGSCDALMNHLMDNFPTPPSMDKDAYDDLTEEVRAMLRGGPTDNVSDAAYIYYIVRMVLKERSIQIFVESPLWKKFAKSYTKVVMGR